MTGITHRRILHRIAAHINGMNHEPRVGDETLSCRAEVINADSHVGDELFVHGKFPGIPSQFAAPFVLWFVVDGDDLLMAARIVPGREEIWHETWSLDGHDSTNVLEDKDFVLIEQFMAKVGEFLSKFDACACSDTVSTAVAALTDLYLLTLNERGVEKQFELSDPQVFDKLHAHLVMLGMEQLPPFPPFPMHGDSSPSCSRHSDIVLSDADFH